MEQYQGVKFNFSQQSQDLTYDNRLDELNYWANLFSELGLAPLHPQGAYGNHSYRTGPETFMITKTGMIPTPELNPENYCHICDFDKDSLTFIIEGSSIPSSESFLHNTLYRSLPEVGAILHGHSLPLNTFAKALKIPVTKMFHDYGTPELGDSALEIAQTGSNFFILKDHGFVALGTDVASAGKLTLDYYFELIKLLKNK